MRFAYERYDIPKSPLDGSTKIYRPEIPIHLIGKTGELFSYGLVDTGADSVVISTTIAEYIGVQCDTTRRWPVHGFAGQTVAAMLGHLELEIVGPRESYCWRLPVAVVEYPDDSQEEIIALGQLGFLEHFDVRFLGDVHLLELKANARFPNNDANRPGSLFDSIAESKNRFRSTSGSWSWKFAVRRPWMRI